MAEKKKILYIVEAMGGATIGLPSDGGAYGGSFFA